MGARAVARAETAPPPGARCTPKHILHKIDIFTTFLTLGGRMRGLRARNRACAHMVRANQFSGPRRYFLTTWLLYKLKKPLFCVSLKSDENVFFWLKFKVSTAKTVDPPPRYGFRTHQIYAGIRYLWCFWGFFSENKIRICSKPILSASNIPEKHSDVTQWYEGSPNYSSYKYSAWSNESIWENSKQVLKFTANSFNFQ